MLNINDLPKTDVQPVCSRWTKAHLAKLDLTHLPEIAVIGAQQAVPILPDMTVWDIWPVQYDDGKVAEIAGGSLWVILSAPRRADPNQRHDEARMRLLHRVDAHWHDCGNLLPDDFAPGSREWSGSTRIDPATNIVTLWFTATGRRGDIASHFEQRLFHASGKLDVDSEHPRITDWHDLTQSVVNDGSLYVDVAVNQGMPGQIKGFRDPYWFRDPADGRGYILFTGSKAAATSQSNYDGVIGIAAASSDDGDGDSRYILLPAIIDADGLANELERPHVFVHGGLYYVFWSSQSQIFAPDGPVGPTGLYGMVAPTLFGPYGPLNETGLVLANPVDEPRQAYAWQVVPSLEVVSFVDFWGINGRDKDADPEMLTRQFGGTIAPIVTVALDGATTRIVMGGK